MITEKENPPKEPVINRSAAARAHTAQLTARREDALTHLGIEEASQLSEGDRLIKQIL